MRVLIARMVHGGYEHHGVGSFLSFARLAAHKDPRISYFNEVPVDDYPTTISRNKVVKIARDHVKADVLFMLDHDNVPDRRFFETAIDWLIEHPAGVIACPYCSSRSSAPGAPDREVVVVVADKADSNGARKVAREEAKTLAGIQPALMVPTGVIAIGMPVFEMVKAPWFEYRYVNADHTILEMTEDYDFSAKCVAAGVEVAVAWDHFAGHDKRETIGRPE